MLRLQYLKYCTIVIFFLSIFLVKSSFADDLLINVLSQDDWESKLLNQARLEDLKQSENFDNLLSIVKNKGVDWRLRVRVIKIIGLMDYDKTIPYLIDIFNDTFLNGECPAIRYYAALALGNYRDERVLNTLINNINDSEILVREAVVHSLGKMGDKRVLPYIIDSLNDKSFAVKIASLRAIESIGDSSVIESLEKFLKDINDGLLKKETERIIEKLIRSNLSSGK